MTAKWESMGVGTRWAPTDDGPWESYIDNTNPANPIYVFERAGGNTAVSQHAGKVVRGFRFKGQIDNPALSLALFEALRGITPDPLPLMQYPGKTVLDSVRGSNTKYGDFYAFDWQVAPSLLPIGLLPMDTNWFQIESPEYGGVRTTQTVQLQRNAAGGGRIFRITPADVQILVSDRPIARVTVEAPNTHVGEVSVITVALAYPGLEFEPIPGVSISVGASVGTAVANAGSTDFSARAVAATDELGVVRFLMKGVEGADASNLIIDLTDEGVGHHLQGKVGLIEAGITNAPFTTSAAFLRSVFSPAFPIYQPVTVSSDPAAPKPGQCVTYPEIPDVPPTPATVKVEDDYGWNAGANSIHEEEGDCELAFNEMQGGPIGAVIGIVGSRALSVADHTRITHGFYFGRTTSGQKVFQVMESGRAVTEPEGYSGEEDFKIQRAGGTVIYYFNGFVYRTSAKPSSGIAIIGCSLYATSDSLPSITDQMDCFWQDLQFVQQVCTSNEPSELMPVRIYAASGNNGWVTVNWERFIDENFNKNPQMYLNSGGGIYQEDGQWRAMIGVSEYYPMEMTDYAEVSFILYRRPRNGTWTDIFGGNTTPPEIVGGYESTIPISTISLTNRIKTKFIGPIDWLPSLDPSYIYYAEMTANIYSQDGTLLIGGTSMLGAVLDIEAEVGDSPEVPSTINIVPVGFDSYTAGLESYQMYLMQDWGGETEDILLYVGGIWVGQMAQLACNDQTLSIQGQPPQTTYMACS